MLVPQGRYVEAGSRCVITYDIPASIWDTERMARQRRLCYSTPSTASPPHSVDRGSPSGEEFQMRMTVANNCLAQVGKLYNLNFLNAETEDAFYCSQLIYKAYQQVGINLNAGLSIEQLPGINTIIYPQDIWVNARTGWRIVRE